MYRFFIKYDTFEYTLMSLASPQLRYEMSRFHIEHPVVGAKHAFLDHMNHRFIPRIMRIMPFTGYIIWP